VACGCTPGVARDQRIIVRRLRAREAGIARFEVRPRWELGGGSEEVRAMGLGDELWAVIGWNSRPDDWTRERLLPAWKRTR